MIVMPIYIFDLDGTLALCDHRLHILNEDWPDKWTEFYNRCDQDLPNKPVIQVLETLRNAVSEIRIFTGRRSDVRAKTEKWLLDNVPSFKHWGCKETLVMRPERDHSPDDYLKKKWLEEMPKGDRSRIVGVFEDRDRVVQMWRSNFIQCFQVEDGDF